MVNWIVDAWLSEVLDINRPSIVVALNRQDGDVCFREVGLDLFGDSNRVSSDLLLSVIPDIMGGVVTRPYEHIWLDLCPNIVKHALESYSWGVAEVAAPFSRRYVTWFGWISNICTAAKVAIAVGQRALSVVKVQVRVRDMNSQISLTRVRVSRNLDVLVIDKVVVSDIEWFCFHHLGHKQV